MSGQEKDEGGNETAAAIAIKQIATPGDSAAFLLGGAAGLPLDFFLMHMGIPFGTVSVATAGFGLGIKKTADSLLFSEGSDRRRKALEKDFDDLTEYLHHHPHDPTSLSRHLRESYDKWKIKVITSKDFRKDLEAVRKNIAKRKNGSYSEKGGSDDGF